MAEGVVSLDSEAAVEPPYPVTIDYVPSGLVKFGVEVLDTSASRRSLPASMLFSEEQDQLFFVDFETGVRRLVFSPLSIVQTFE